MQRAVSLSALVAHLDQAMQYVYTHSSATSNSTATAADLVVPNCATTSIVQNGLISALMQEISSAAVNTQGVGTSSELKCSTVGHVLLIADAQRGALASVTLLPISTAEVHVQYAVSLQDTKYYTAYHLQDTLTPRFNILSQPLSLVEGVHKISSFSLELRSR